MNWQLKKGSTDFLSEVFLHQNPAMINRLIALPEWPQLSIPFGTKFSLLHIIAATGALALYPHVKHLHYNDQQNKLKRSPLHIAALYGQEEFCRLLISQGADINLQDSEGYTALMLAAHKGNTLCCNTLLELGANPTLRNIINQTAQQLGQATSTNPCRDFHQELIALTQQTEPFTDRQRQLLLLLNQHAHLLTWQMDDQSSHFLESLFSQKNSLLIQHLTTLAQSFVQNSTAMHDDDLYARLLKRIILTETTAINHSTLQLAALHGHEAFCHLLLICGAKIDHKDREGNTALMLAASQGHKHIAELLLMMGANPTLQNKEKKTVEQLWLGSENPLSLFHAELIALARKTIEPFSGEQQALLKRILQQTSLLTWQSDTNPCCFLQEILIHNNQAIIDELLKLSLTELNNSHHPLQRTLLHFAALHGHVNFCRALLSCGATINQQDQEGNTALMLAASQGHAGVCQYLLEMGANPILCNKLNATAESLFVSPGLDNPIQRFHENLLALASLQLEDEQLTEQQQSLRLLIIQCPHLLTWRTATNTMCFLTAVVIHNNQGVVAELAQMPEWANIIAKTTNGSLSLLHHIAFHNHVDLYPYLNSLAINGQNNRLKRTPLLQAALSGSDAFCRLLIGQQAYLNRQDSEGHSALMIAAIKGHASTCRLLLEAGALTDLVNCHSENAESLWTKHHPDQANPIAVHYRSSHLTNKKAALLNLLAPPSYSFWPKQEKPPQNLALTALVKNITDADFKDSDLNATADDLLQGVIDAWQVAYQFTLSEKISIEFKKILKPTLHEKMAEVNPPRPMP